MGSKDLWCVAIAVLQVACVIQFICLISFVYHIPSELVMVLSVIVSVLKGQACMTKSIMHQFTYGNSNAHSFSLVP